MWPAVLALEAWQRGERSLAIGAWTRLALQLQGAEDDLDLVAAALRLECVDGGSATLIRRGYFSNGSFSSPTSVRVRQLFDLPELAGRDFGPGAGLVVSVNLLVGPSDKADERIEFPVAIDAAGRTCALRCGTPRSVTRRFRRGRHGTPARTRQQSEPSPGA